MALKAALVPLIVGLVIMVVGVVLLVVGLLNENSTLLIAGIIVGIFGLAFGIIIVGYEGKKVLRTICPECQKFMGDTDKGINYSFVCKEYKTNFDSNNNLRDYTYFYTCSIECPHCGSTNTFDYKVTAKNESKADTQVDKYIKEILKIKQNDKK